MKPARSRVSPFQRVNSRESRRSSSQVFGKSSRPEGMPRSSNISRLYQMPQEPAVTGKPYVWPAKRQLASTVGGQFSACAYWARCISASSGCREPRAPRAVGEVQRIVASGGSLAAIRASSTSWNSCSPVPHWVSAIRMVASVASKSLAIASNPVQKSPPPPGVQKVTVIFGSVAWGVDEGLHPPRRAIPPPHPTRRRNARRSIVCRATLGKAILRP